MNLMVSHIFPSPLLMPVFPAGSPVRAVITVFFGSLVFAIAGCSNHHLGNHASDAPDLSPASQIIRFYQGPLDHLSAVRYGGCPMYPPCSEYSLSAIQKHGFLIGWIMTCDRLIRCGRDETRLSPETLVEGSWKYVDTLEQNDSWWYSTANGYLPTPSASPGTYDWGVSLE